MSARGKAAIAGFYEIPTEKELPGRSTYSVLAEVARGAITDAGLRAEDIDGLIGQETLNSMTLAEVLGLKPRYTASMTVHGASGASSIATATAAITAGLADYVLCIFGESRQRSSSRAIAVAAAQRTGGPGNRGSEWEAPFGPVIAANGGYGLMKQRHMFEFGTTQEQFAKMAVDERTNALENPNAVWKGQPITIQDVLDSRFTNEPLHLLESVMPCSGAAAVVVTSAERARAMPHPPVYVLGIGGPATTHDTIWQEDEITTTPTAMTAPAALRMAEYNINDMQFAEFYDCYTILAMVCLEDAGFCEKGEIGAFYESTDTTYSGEFPVNTDGGQISAGQPGGNAGGFRHVVEATRQVMGRAESRQVEKSDLCMVNG
jgi:acetyl-CoA C-acetyltransferase